MAGRRLSPEERQLWSKLAQSVRPLKGARRGRGVDAPATPPKANEPEDMQEAAPAKKGRAVRGRVPPPRTPPALTASSPDRTPLARLDDSWERRIISGSIAPEMSVDLHGHTLESAHRRLNQVLAVAVAQGVRVLLVVTGNPRPAPADFHGERNRGAIRAEIGEWLALSGHADAIASIRTAHQRHGGKGALYIILRRRR